MAKEVQDPPVIDPDNVQEIICDGRLNVSARGTLATMTFTHSRPDAAKLLGDGTIDLKSVVRARVVLTMDNLVALRDLLNRILQEPDRPAPTGGTKRPGGTSRHS